MSDTLRFMRRSYGRVLRAKRLRSGLSQKSLARAAHVRPETVSRIETGKGNPTLKTLVNLMKAVEHS